MERELAPSVELIPHPFGLPLALSMQALAMLRDCAVWQGLSSFA